MHQSHMKRRNLYNEKELDIDELATASNSSSNRVDNEENKVDNVKIRIGKSINKILSGSEEDILIRERSKLINARCVLTKDDLLHNKKLNVLCKNVTYNNETVFQAGILETVELGNIYSISFRGDRKSRCLTLCQEEVLKNAIREVHPRSTKELPPGTRLCAYWSKQYKYLHIGTAAVPNKRETVFLSTDVFVKFDDGDERKIDIENIRFIPQNSISEDEEEEKEEEEELETEAEEVDEVNSIKPSSCENNEEMEGMIEEENQGIKVEENERMEEEAIEDFSFSFTDPDTFHFPIEKLGEIFTKTYEFDQLPEDRIVQSPESKVAELNSSNSASRATTVLPAKNLWKFSRQCNYILLYNAIERLGETIWVGDAIVFHIESISYIGYIKAMWETSTQKTLRVNLLYPPDKIETCHHKFKYPGALFTSNHVADVDLQAVFCKCEVLPFKDFIERPRNHNSNTYYLAGSYDHTKTTFHILPEIYEAGFS